MISVLILFYPSRRRHTRLVSDWSSDVCSSDLSHDIHLRASRNIVGRAPQIDGLFRPEEQHRCSRKNKIVPPMRCRSEERRVGKECIYGWLAVDYKYNNKW